MTDIEENMAKLSMNFDTFIVSPKIRNCWVHERDLSVYVRRSMRFIGKEAVKCLDIASVEVNEKRRGCGIFKEFLARFEVEAKNLNRAVFVESILEPRLLQFLFKRGYIKHPHSTDICPSVFKVLA